MTAGDPDDRQPVTVLATYRAAHGCGDEVAAALVGYAPLTRAEPGCVTFLAHRSAETPDVFVLYEQYRDRGAFDAHLASEHYATVVRDRIRPLLDEREVTFLRVLGD